MNIPRTWQLPMPIPELALGEVHVWRAYCVPEEIDVAAFRQLLTSWEMARAERLATALLRRRYLQTHALLHTLLAAYTRAGAQGCDLGVHEMGKPYLRSPQLSPPLEFNMSHAAELVAIAVARGHDVGVDVELLRPLDDLDAMIRASCSAREASLLATLTPEARLARFYALWTRKEAWLKLLGVGLGKSLPSVEVDVPVGVRLFDIAVDELAARHGGEIFMGALALPDGVDAVSIKIFDAVL